MVPVRLADPRQPARVEDPILSTFTPNTLAGTRAIQLLGGPFDIHHCGRVNSEGASNSHEWVEVHWWAGRDSGGLVGDLAQAAGTKWANILD